MPQHRSSNTYFLEGALSDGGANFERAQLHPLHRPLFFLSCRLCLLLLNLQMLQLLLELLELLLLR